MSIRSFTRLRSFNIKIKITIHHVHDNLLWSPVPEKTFIVTSSVSPYIQYSNFIARCRKREISCFKSKILLKSTVHQINHHLVSTYMFSFCEERSWKISFRGTFFGDFWVICVFFVHTTGPQSLALENTLLIFLYLNSVNRK